MNPNYPEILRSTCEFHFSRYHDLNMRLSRRQLFLSTAFTASLGCALITRRTYAGTQPFDNLPSIPCSQANPAGNDHSQAATVSPNVPEPKHQLDIGEWLIIPNICPEVLYFPTSLTISPGATYQFSAQGKWKDNFIRCGPEGWPGLFLQAFNRIAWQRMFLLCGSIGKTDKYAFPIGRRRNWIAPLNVDENNNELCLFANDWMALYDNNKALTEQEGGPMRVSIQRIS